MLVKGLDVPVSAVPLILLFGLILRQERQTARLRTCEASKDWRSLHLDQVG
jgi:hypothetical protein